MHATLLIIMDALGRMFRLDEDNIALYRQSIIEHRHMYIVQTLKESSFAVHGPRLLNGILKDLRDYSGEPEGF